MVLASDPYAGVPSTTYIVTIDPKHANLVHFGLHSLDIPAKAICAADSGYGTDSFDRECRAEHDPVTIVAIVRQSADGTPRIDLKPQLRFSPKRTVTLRLFVQDLSTTTAADLRIMYCPTETTDGCVDESVTDPTLRTHADVEASSLFRRIKHFSGYFVET